MKAESPGGYAVWRIGCQMNDADARSAADGLEAFGFRPAPPAEADFLLVASCVIRRQAEEKVRARLRLVAAEKRRRPDLRVALMGCLVGTDPPDRLRERFPFVDLFLPPSDTRPLFEWLERAGFPRRPPGCGPAQGAPVSDGGVRALVPAVLGCSMACAYCVIPSRRGPERSRPAPDILREAGERIRRGAREIVLLGQIVDRYGLDLDPPETLAGLLRAAERIDGVLRVRFLTSHPRFFPDGLIDAVSESGVLCPHFEIPVQSGDDGVLARMRRGYRVDDYRRLVGRIRGRIPGAAIHTDLITGFPGETGAQFEATLRFVEEMRFDKIHLARYSERPGTHAARRYPDDVPEAEKERRRAAIESLQAGIQGEINRRYLGKRVRVLVERADDRRPGRWLGRTPDDRRVCFDGPGDLAGREVEARIGWTGPFSLVGEAVPGPGPPAAGRPGQSRPSQRRASDRNLS